MNRKHISSPEQQRSHAPEKRYKGIPASSGIMMGHATVLFNEGLASVNEHISNEKIPEELERFTLALENSAGELQHIIEVAQKEAANVTPILETYLLILMDPSMHDSIRKRIQEGYSAENAVIQEFDAQKQFFKLAKDPILRERAVELDHVTERLLGGLRNRTIAHEVAAGSIVAGPSITPTDLMLFKKAGALAFITEIGGIASHASILARTLGIPAVIGVREITQKVNNGDLLIVDGYSGMVIVNPKPETLAKYQKKTEQEAENKRKLGKLVKALPETHDGHSIHLLANIDTLDDVDSARLHGAQGIGLVRSEYLIIANQRFPSEEEQFEWYTQIAERMYPLPVTIRAFDVGSDKYAEGLPEEDNPALGVRGMRFLLQRRDIFRDQVKAVLRASQHKNIRLMLPMISTRHELQEALEFIEKCRKSLDKQHIAHDPKMPVGMMIETPAAAIMSAEFARYVQFFSIGTNDLTQYTLAADRVNEHVADIFDPFHPAVLRLMQLTVQSAHNQGITVGICGELAGHAAATELLIGLDIDELSVAPPLLLELKKRIRKTVYSHAQKLASEILPCQCNTEVRRRLRSR
jgi:phosphotransferase system enzyme I (PtsI)